METTAELRAVANLVNCYTGGRFYLWGLAGRQKASVRAHIMGTLLGRKATQRESGITMLVDALIAAFKVSGSCNAAREDALIAALRAAAK